MLSCCCCWTQFCSLLCGLHSWDFLVCLSFLAHSCFSCYTVEFCLSTYNQCLSNNFLLMDSNPCCTFFHFLYICFIWNDIYFVWPSQWQCRDSKVCTCQQVKLIPLFVLTIMGSKSNVQDSVWQRRIVCGQREGQCPSLSMSTHFIIGKEKCRSVSFAVINASTLLINLPPSCCLFPFMLPK